MFASSWALARVKTKGAGSSHAWGTKSRLPAWSSTRSRSAGFRTRLRMSFPLGPARCAVTALALKQTAEAREQLLENAGFRNVNHTTSLLGYTFVILCV